LVLSSSLTWPEFLNGNVSVQSGNEERSGKISGSMVPKDVTVAARIVSDASQDE